MQSLLSKGLIEGGGVTLNNESEADSRVSTGLETVQEATVKFIFIFYFLCGTRVEIS